MCPTFEAFGFENIPIMQIKKLTTIKPKSKFCLNNSPFLLSSILIVARSGKNINNDATSRYAVKPAPPSTIIKMIVTRNKT